MNDTPPVLPADSFELCFFGPPMPGYGLHLYSGQSHIQHTHCDKYYFTELFICSAQLTAFYAPVPGAVVPLV